MLPYILAAVGGYLIGDSLKGKQYAEGGIMALAEEEYADGGGIEKSGTYLVQVFENGVTSPFKIVEQKKIKANSQREASDMALDMLSSFKKKYKVTKVTISPIDGTPVQYWWDVSFIAPPEPDK